MGTKTGISWTSATWNPIRGCSPVSHGCKNCYASKVAKRFSGSGAPYEGLVRINAAGQRTDEWNGVIRPIEKHLLDPLSWKDGRRIFVNSMSDLFHENLPFEEIDKIFAVMALCPQHEFQILTKRPARMLAHLSDVETPMRIHRKMFDIVAYGTYENKKIAIDPRNTWPLPNVRVGVSVENQKAADDRLDYLCELASQGWNTMVSFEPLINTVDPGPWWLSLGAKTWGIVGGESGQGARPMHPDWARSLRDQCKAAGVPFFFKQWGVWAPVVDRDIDDPDWRLSYTKYHSDPDFCGLNLEGGSGFHGDRYHVLQRIGAKAAGCLLDGVEHHEFPEVTA